jgi:peptidoglycan/LPS O-acetylase OafA/YrhL
MATGRWALAHRPHWLRAADTPATGPRKALAMLGRWSLSYYLLHQPVLIGLLTAWLWLRG